MGHFASSTRPDGAVFICKARCYDISTLQEESELKRKGRRRTVRADVKRPIYSVTLWRQQREDFPEHGKETTGRGALTRVGTGTSSRFQSRDSAIVALLAEITIVTRNFFHPKRGSIPACLASDSNLLCSRTCDCHVTFTFPTLIVTSPIRYPSGTFCFTATALYDTTQVQEPCGNCLDIVFGMRDHMYVLL